MNFIASLLLRGLLFEIKRAPRAPLQLFNEEAGNRGSLPFGRPMVSFHLSRIVLCHKMYFSYLLWGNV